VASLEHVLGRQATAYVRELTACIRGELGERLVGAWLFGSAALGDFSVDRSDLDIQAVSKGELSLAERRQLAAALGHEALPCPARGLEFVLYSRRGLEARDGPEFQLNLNSGARLQQHVAFDPHDDPRFWFIIDVSIGRQHGRPLHGPSPQAVFPELPRALVHAGLREALDWYAAQPAAEVDTLLNACRTWAFATDGRWRSKAESARWARTRVPDPGPVDRALRVREGASEPSPTAAEAGALVDVAHAALTGGPP
jgi:hypothetical protein